MDVNDIQGDSEDKKLIAEWEDILWDEGSGTLGIKFMNIKCLDMAMSKEDLTQPLKLRSNIEEILILQTLNGIDFLSMMD